MFVLKIYIYYEDDIRVDTYKTGGNRRTVTCKSATRSGRSIGRKRVKETSHRVLLTVPQLENWRRRLLKAGPRGNPNVQIGGLSSRIPSAKIQVGSALPLRSVPLHASESVASTASASDACSFPFKLPTVPGVPGGDKGDLQQPEPAESLRASDEADFGRRKL
eukprot:3214579-Rhodomonas_salina.3